MAKEREQSLVALAVNFPVIVELVAGGFMQVLSDLLDNGTFHIAAD